MANVTISPNMNLTIPTVSVDPGPDWANNINASLVAIDSHDHTPGRGVAIPSGGISINSDLPFNNNNATTLRSVRFQPQATNITLPTDLGALYEVGVDLWYNDGAGNLIRITQSGSVAGAAGTITGLPSGTASAVYNSISGTFIFQSATNTPANIDVASVTLRNFTTGSFGLTLNPPLAMTANFSLTLPNIPAADSFMTINTSGEMAGSVPLSQGITTSMIADGAITAPKLAAGVLPSLKNVTFTANGSFIAPAGVTTIFLTGCGGGGGGGSGGNSGGFPNGASGGGGGAGAFNINTQMISVIPLTSYPVVVGAGGGPGALGGSSTFNGHAFVGGNPGGNGQPLDVPGIGGAATVANTFGGNGGERGVPGSNGGNSPSFSGGIGGVALNPQGLFAGGGGGGGGGYGGNGGNGGGSTGGVNGSPGGNGQGFGGGGGGGSGASSPGGVGGAGGSGFGGFITITYFG